MALFPNLREDYLLYRPPQPRFKKNFLFCFRVPSAAYLEFSFCRALTIFLSTVKCRSCGFFFGCILGILPALFQVAGKKEEAFSTFDMLSPRGGLYVSV